MNVQSKRMWVAMVIAPLIAPVLFALWAIARGAISAHAAIGANWPSYLDLVFMESLWVLIASYAATAVIGVPLVLWLRARAALGLASVSIAGSLAGFVAGVATGLGVVAMAPSALHLGVSVVLQIGGSGLVLGLVTGLCFWIVAGITIRPSGPPTAAA